MLIVNKLTAPGEIKRLELHPDTITVQTRNIGTRTYKLVPEYNLIPNNKEVS